MLACRLEEEHRRKAEAEEDAALREREKRKRELVRWQRLSKRLIRHVLLPLTSA